MTDSCGAGDKIVALDDAADGRTARLARDADGDPLGAAVFFDADDLRELVDGLDETDRVAYRVMDGDLVLDADAGGDSGGNR